MTDEPDNAEADVQPQPAESYIIEIDSDETLQASRPDDENDYYGSDRPPRPREH